MEREYHIEAEKSDLWRSALMMTHDATSISYTWEA